MPEAVNARSRTLTFAAAAREYGLQVEDVRALVADGIVWTVTPPGKSRERVVRDGLEAWVRAGCPKVDAPVVSVMPRRVF